VLNYYVITTDRVPEYDEISRIRNRREWKNGIN
jgi:hypothetical protein